jgi:hypothetical protein
MKEEEEEEREERRTGESSVGDRHSNYRRR